MHPVAVHPLQSAVQAVQVIGVVVDGYDLPLQVLQVAAVSVSFPSLASAQLASMEAAVTHFPLLTKYPAAHFEQTPAASCLTH